MKVTFFATGGNDPMVLGPVVGFARKVCVGGTHFYPTDGFGTGGWDYPSPCDKTCKRRNGAFQISTVERELLSEEEQALRRSGTAS